MTQAAHSEAAPDSDPGVPVAAPSPPREASVRALVTGGVLGLMLAAGNVYTGFKTGVIDSCSITAALLAFGVFAVMRRPGRTPYGPLENNVTQTVASSAAVMSFATGTIGPIPALAFMGVRFSTWAVISFGAAIAMVGIFAGVLLRRRLVVDEALPFPTGIATGEVIETVFSAHRTAMRRIVLLVSGIAIAAVVTWFRDGRPAIIPQGIVFGGTVGGVAAATLGLGFAWSPLLLSTGAILGLRTSIAIMLGAAAARTVLAPWLVHRGIIADGQIGTANAWLIWPSLGLMMAGSFIPLLLDGGTFVRAFRQLAFFRRRKSSAPRTDSREWSMRVWGPLLAVSVAVIFFIAWRIFGVAPLAILIGIVLSLILANVAGRATGETDISPSGSFGTVNLAATSSLGTVAGLISGLIGMGLTTQSSQMLWSFRAGHHLGASPRAQIRAQIVGALVGAVVTVPVYLVIASVYGLGNEKMPAISVLTWKATSDAMHGLSALPRLGAAGGLVAVGVGAALTLLSRLRLGQWLPSAAAVGVGVMLPFSAALAICAGALLALGARAVFSRRGVDQTSILAIAAGGLAGESMMGVIIAILMWTGVL